MEPNLYEAFGGEYEEFVQDCNEAEHEAIQSEDAHLEAAYEDRYSTYDSDLLDMEDFACRWDDDPNVYGGTYSEE